MPKEAHSGVGAEGAETIPLSPLDLLMSRYYASIVLMFRIKPERSFDKVHKTLQESLNRTCLEVPIFGGRVFEQSAPDPKSAKGKCEIQICEGWNPEIVLNDISDSWPTYDDLEDEGFEQGYMEKDKLLPKVDAWNLTAEGVPAILCQANFVESGLLLGISLHHAAVDGMAAVFFIKTWAQQTRSLQGLPQSDSILTLEPGSNDRTVLEKMLTSQAEVQSGNSRSSEEEANLWRILGLLPPSADFAPLTVDPSLESKIFYISADSFKALTRAGHGSEKPSSNGSKLTGNDILSSFLWRSSIRARAKASDGLSDDYSPDSMTHLDIALNGRALFGQEVPWSYLGVMTLFATPSMTVGDLVSDTTTLADISSKTRQAIEFVTKERALAAFRLATTLPDYRFVPLSYATMKGAEVFFNSWIPLQIHQVSFGDDFSGSGCPDSARILKMEYGGYNRRIVALPMKAKGGFEVLIEMKDTEMQALQTDDEFSKYAKPM